jgi:hypothetical protein
VLHSRLESQEEKPPLLEEESFPPIGEVFVRIDSMRTSFSLKENKKYDPVVDREVSGSERGY